MDDAELRRRADSVTCQHHSAIADSEGSFDLPCYYPIIR